MLDCVFTKDFKQVLHHLVTRCRRREVTYRLELSIGLRLTLVLVTAHFI